MTVGRFWIRRRRAKGIKLDDLLNALALAALLAFIATATAYFPVAYAAEYFKLGLTTISPTEEELIYALKLKLANGLLFWVTIYGVKASFLATYWMVFKVSSNFRKAWWFVTVYVGLTFLAVFLAGLWSCGSPSDYDSLEACSHPNVASLVSIQAVWCALDISSDILLIALPLFMVKQMHLKRAQKIGLAAIFAVVAVDILFNFLHTLYSIDTYYFSSFAEANAAWTIIEPALAVIVCASPSYRTLLSSRSRARAPPYEDLQPYPTSMCQHSEKSKTRQELLEMDSMNEQSTQASDGICQEV